MLCRLDPQDMLRWRRLLFSEACGETIVAPHLIHETLSTLSERSVSAVRATDGVELLRIKQKG